MADLDWTSFHRHTGCDYDLRAVKSPSEDCPEVDTEGCH
jgi:hypothetical protein